MKISYFLKLVLLFTLILAFVLPNFTGLAQEDENLAEFCQLDKIEEECQNIEPSECRQILEKCEEYYRKESERIGLDLTKTEQEKKSLQNKIYILSKRIRNLDYQIYQSNLMVKDLGFQIKDTEGSIENTSLKIEDSKQKLINILRNIYEEDQKSLIEILLSEADLSVFFANLVALEALYSKNQELLQNIKELKNSLEGQKQSLDEEKQELEDLVTIQTLQKQESAKTKGEQEYFLELTETEYQKYLKEKEETEKKATEIRARIFELIGVPEAPTFGEAYEIAKYVEGITGVRPAFLLAVLTQESNIGKNVGQCYLKNPSTGEGVTAFNGKKIWRVMKPSRDVPPFLEITKELGRDPYSTPVSCPMSYGWGGAMGPAQFIPSTWVLYRDKVKAITGKEADPWNIKDAFLAAALYLRDSGAANQTYTYEWRAAMIYFSGTTRRTRYNGYGFYGDSVMKITARYQADIEAIESGS